MKHTSKLPQVGTTIFAKINRIARKHNAVNLSQGFPGFSPDHQLLEMVHQAMLNGNNQYAPLPGLQSLRETLCAKMENLYGQNYDPESEITITAGATQAIFTAISAFVKKNDEVIVFKPAYDCYEPTIELYGGKPVLIEMKAPKYRIDWDAVKQKINVKTKMIIINTPHNPSGTVLTKADLKALEKIVEDTDILILSDEVYEHIIFDGREHQSVARFPKLAERAFITYSFGKTFHVTGWKMGYCIAPKALMTEFKKVHQYNVFCVNHPFQVALNEYMQKPEHYLELPAFYQEKRDFFLEAIKDSKFEFTPAQGTFFQTVSYKNITDEKDTDFAIRLIEEKQLAAIPVSVFNKNRRDDKMLRFCFAKKNETLKKAAEVINSL